MDGATCPSTVASGSGFASLEDVADAGVLAEYSVGHVLGKGHFATVRLARKLASDELVALKLIEISSSSLRQEELFQREIAAMRSAQHPNVLALRRICPCVRFDSRDVILLELELAPGGELFDYLLVGGAFPEPVARAYFHQLLSGLRACHAQGIFHRDIKPENILLSAGFQLKLADFGLAAINPELDLLRTPCGTASYQAPEVLRRLPYSGDKADIWSAGVVLFIMLAGNPPFRKAARGDWWFNAITLNAYDSFWMAHQRAPIPTIHHEAQQLINSIFTVEAGRRASVEELLASNWLHHGSGEVASPLPDAAFLHSFMGERRATIDAQNEQKKANAKDLKERRKASAAAGSGSTAFDKVVYRSMGDAEPSTAAAAPPPAKDAVAPPAAPVDDDATAAPPRLEHDGLGVSALFRFYAADEPNQLLRWLGTACGQVVGQPVVVDAKAFDVTAGDAEHLGLHVQVRTLEDAESDLLCVTASRTAGSHWSFGQAWMQLLQQLASLGCLGASDALAKSRATPLLGELPEPDLPLPPLPEEETSAELQAEAAVPSPETATTEVKISDVLDDKLVL